MTTISEMKVGQFYRLNGETYEVIRINEEKARVYLAPSFGMVIILSSADVEKAEPTDPPKKSGVEINVSALKDDTEEKKLKKN